MASQAAQEPTSAGEGAATPRKRLDFVTRAMVLRLREGDTPMSYEQIASTLGISESSARRVCQFDVADHKAGIKRLMRTDDVRQVANWAKANRVQAAKGYFQGMQAWLQATDAIDTKAAVQTHVNVTPTVVLNMPFPLGSLADYKPQGPQAIEATAVPVLPPKDAA